VSLRGTVGIVHVVYDVGHIVYVRPSYVQNGSRTKELTEGTEGAVTREKNKRSQVTKGVDRKGGVIDSHTLERHCESGHNPPFYI
jgi:hypothetical protein